MDGQLLKNDLAENIKYYREKIGLTQAKLAENSEISVPYMGALERGEKWPSADILVKIANALNVSVADLFERNDISYKQDALKDLINSQIQLLEKINNTYYK